MGYLQNLWNALDFGSLRDTLLRVASVLLCLILHETCHGLAALALGDPTAKRSHRLSLNPLRHIDWVGLAAMVLTGVGWAKPVPVDPHYFKRPKQGMAITALAGPVSNFVLAYAALLVCSGLYHFAPDHIACAYAILFFSYMAVLSIGLGLFNLIPIPPLDGSKILFSLLPDRIYHTILRYERYVVVAVVLLAWSGVFSAPLNMAMEAVTCVLCRLSGFPFAIPAYYFF